MEAPPPSDEQNGDGDGSTGRESEMEIVYDGVDDDADHAVEDEEDEKAEVLPAGDTAQGVQRRREHGDMHMLCADEECEYQHVDTLESERLDLLYNSISAADQAHLRVYHRWS